MTQSKIEIIKFFWKIYPYKTLFLLLALFITSVLDTLGILALLPILNFSLSSSGGESFIQEIFLDIFGVFGVGVNLENLLLLMVALFSIKALVLSHTRKYIRTMTADVAYDLQGQMFKALFDVRWDFFVGNQAGHFVNALVSETAKCATLYLQWCTLAQAMINLLVISIAIAFTSLEVAICTALAGVFLLLVLKKYMNVSKQSGQAITKLAKSLSNNLADSVQGAKMLKSMHLTDPVIETLKNEAREYKYQRIRQNMAKDHVNIIREPLIVFMLAFSLYVSVELFSYPMSEIIVLFALFYRALGLWGILQGNYQAINAHEGYFWSLNKLLKDAAENKEVVTIGRDVPPLKSDIKLNNIEFCYNNEIIINGLDLEIKKGGITTLVGPSGSGKTTIADLIIGLYEPSKGEVLLDGVSLNEFSLASWRKKIGYISQDPIMFHKTIRENIRLNDFGISDDQIYTALEKAEALSFLKESAGGLDTIIGERGMRLSGGQRQRLSIARALAHSPELLILDEATTALDPVTEKEICSTLKHLSDEITIFAISHQDAIVDVSDRVYELKEKKAHIVR